MTKNEIIKILSDIINNFLESKIDTDEVIEQLITRINPLDIYELDDELLITDCYFAIKHLVEEGYETTIRELEYFKECFEGQRLYNINDKNEFILDC
ncbi:MAG TPA: hypothetical protein PKK61_08520 [Defluviitaleaceae bacterium]|jgi:hypothetical protein|nr:hypothetical protein [Candidatus Epulonipiscium sp.]HOA81087.1 hypothetical protein [Defluviitaleaceae bacterium]